MEGAHGVLLSIYGGSDLGLFEINEAASLVAEAAHPEANIIFGAVIDDTLGDEVKVTVIAAGFDSGQLPYKKVDIRREPAASSRSAAPPVHPSPQPPPTRPAEPEPADALTVPVANGARQPVRVDDDLDVPDFLK
jgi:cell division protein FtsZ